jgi:hypothetical protein
MDRCSLFRNISAEALCGGVEIHHHPLTIYDIADIVFTRMVATRTDEDEDHITSLTVANKVMELHYRNQVGLVPLTATLHELVHADRLTVHPAMIFGDWITFLREHSPWISEDVKNRLFVEGSNWDKIITNGYDLTSLETAPVYWKASKIVFDNLIESASEKAPVIEE